MDEEQLKRLIQTQKDINEYFRVNKIDVLSAITAMTGLVVSANTEIRMPPEEYMKICELLYESYCISRKNWRKDVKFFENFT